MEGLHYDLAQAHLAPYLNHAPGYIEDSHQSREIKFEGLSINCERVFFTPPVSTSSYTTSPVISGEAYEYKLTSVYNYGESLPSDSIIVTSGSSNTITSPNVITWSGVEGITTYNVYGRKLGTPLTLLSTVEGTTFTDSGVVTQPAQESNMETYPDTHPI